MAAFVRQAFELGHRGVHVPDGQQAAGDEATRIGAAPFVNMPVIIGAQVDESLRLVFSLDEQPTVDHREAREIQRCRDAVDIHVSDTGVNIITAGTQLREGGWLHTVFLARPADHGVEPDGRNLPALVFPEIRTVRLGAQFWRGGKCCAGKMLVKHITRFGDVIVSADDHQIVHIHICPSSIFICVSALRPYGHRLSRRECGPRRGAEDHVQQLAGFDRCGALVFGGRNAHECDLLNSASVPESANNIPDVQIFRPQYRSHDQTHAGRRRARPARAGEGWLRSLGARHCIAAKLILPWPGAGFLLFLRRCARAVLHLGCLSGAAPQAQ